MLGRVSRFLIGLVLFGNQRLQGEGEFCLPDTLAQASACGCPRNDVSGTDPDGSAPGIWQHFCTAALHSSYGLRSLRPRQLSIGSGSCHLSMRFPVVNDPGRCFRRINCQPGLAVTGLRNHCLRLAIVSPAPSDSRSFSTRRRFFPFSGFEFYGVS